ncbi:DUF1127 domain-containing protein [Jiella pacifica]|uniref:DUF1127 domain-containing protein n=1 Tax=Jiella pacifica TaxID=2696469 RepID=A0A6N9T504_9HYPH|nr:DUF1127 domain-containing protein [Jiella pacifica]NDW05285.1 DUF1127 domain-containing protein [Jiella pacifica]
MTDETAIEQGRITRTGASVAKRGRHWLGRFARRLRRCAARRRQRMVLAELSDRQLRDLGIARDAAMEEARKPFWR